MGNQNRKKCDQFGCLAFPGNCLALELSGRIQPPVVSVEAGTSWMQDRQGKEEIIAAVDFISG
jgi:hypothetical protein